MKYFCNTSVFEKKKPTCAVEAGEGDTDDSINQTQQVDFEGLLSPGSATPSNPPPLSPPGIGTGHFVVAVAIALFFLDSYFDLDLNLNLGVISLILLVLEMVSCVSDPSKEDISF